MKKSPLIVSLLTAVLLISSCSKEKEAVTPNLSEIETIIRGTSLSVECTISGKASQIKEAWFELVADDLTSSTVHCKTISSTISADFGKISMLEGYTCTAYISNGKGRISSPQRHICLNTDPIELPDEGLRNYIYSLDIDSNHDGIITYSESNIIAQLGNNGTIIVGDKIKSLVGIGAFGNISTLSIDVPDGNYTDLGNVLNELADARLNNLRNLYLGNCHFNTQVFPCASFPDLEKLTLNNVGIEKLDITGIPCLMSLELINCLSELKSDCHPLLQNIIAQGSNIKLLNANNCPKLKKIYLTNCNYLERVEALNCPELEKIMRINCPKLTTIYK